VPAPDTVERFIALVKRGSYVAAIERFYADDATMQDNLNQPRRGRAALIEAEQAMLAKVTIRTVEVGPVLIDGDDVVIRWVFELSDAAGRTRRLDEVAVQRWSGDRIVAERFYFDPGQLLGPDRP
jgi:ketosteroid isomerase-like protein